MFEYDEFGLFTSQKHIDNFLYYMTTIYQEDFFNYKFFALPENELSFIYIISEIFDYPLISDNQDFHEIFKNIDKELNYIEDNQQEVIDLAYGFLNFSIQISDTRKLPLTYGILIKNAMDILSSNNDIIQFKQYEVVSITRNYYELKIENSSYKSFELY